MKKPSIFIASEPEGLSIARKLGRHLEMVADVTLWAECSFCVHQDSFETLLEVADRSDFAIVILTNDNRPQSAKSDCSQRRNILFELGILAGRLGLSRIFVVVVNSNEFSVPWDVISMMYLTLDTNDVAQLDSALSKTATAINETIGKMQTWKHPAVEYYSCFLSYSWKDKDFAITAPR